MNTNESHNFLKKDGNEAGSNIPGHKKRRTGNFIKAGHLFFFGVLGRWMMATMMVASALMGLPSRLGSIFMGKTQGLMSKAALLLPLLLTSCDATYEDKPVVNTVEELASLEPIVACVYLLKWPLMIAAMGVAMHGLALVKYHGGVVRNEYSTPDEEEES